MAESSLSIDSTSEELADYFIKNCKLSKEEKEIFIKEGISGDVLLEAISSLKELGIKPTPIVKIKSFLKNKEAKFKPKEITEKISISNEEDIKSFFEKYIGFKGDVTSQIKGENELISLGEEDMKKSGLNFGQRKRLIRYINHFKVLKSKKDITITITKESNEKEVNEFLKNELNLSDKTIEETALDAQVLFELTEEDVNGYSDLMKPEEYEMLKKFIKKRDEIMKKNEIKITKNSSKDDISKFIKEKLDIDIYNQDYSNQIISVVDECDNMTKEEKEIIKNFIKQEIDVIPENKSDDNISVESEDDDTDVIKLNDPNFNDNTNDCN